MKINAQQIFQGLPTDLNAEQKKIFSKLDELKQDIKNGKSFDYEDSILSGDRIAFVQTFYDNEKKQPHQYFGYNYTTQACTFCEYSQEGPEKQMMNYDINGRLHIEDFKNGLLYEEVSYKNNQLNGHVLQRYANGQVKEDAYYQNGERDQYGYHGFDCIDYREDGTVIRKAQYTAGQLDGNCIDYYDNGKIKEVANYLLGQKDGLCEQYDLQGNKTEIFYMNGKAMDSVPNEEELGAITDSFSFDDVLASFETKDSEANAVDKQPKRSLSEILSVLSDDIQVSVAIDTDYDKDKNRGHLFKEGRMVPPPPPVVPRGNQTPQISQAPKNQTSDKGIVPPQVFLHGKGGR